MSSTSHPLPTPQRGDSIATSKIDEESTDSEDYEDSDEASNPPYDESRDPYDKLLATVSRETLVKVLRNFSEKLPDRGRALQMITKTLEQQKKKLSSPNATGQVLGKRAKTQACDGCGKEFDETENEVGSCKFYMWHPGSLEMNNDDDAWADTDFPEHVPPDDNPEGFNWTCCDRETETAGCEKYRHVVAADASRKLPKQEAEANAETSSFSYKFEPW